VTYLSETSWLLWSSWTPKTPKPLKKTGKCIFTDVRCGRIRVSSPSQILTIKIAITIQVPNNAGLYSVTLDPLHSITPSLRAKSVFPIRPTAFAKRSTRCCCFAFCYTMLLYADRYVYAIQLRKPTDRTNKKKKKKQNKCCLPNLKADSLYRFDPVVGFHPNEPTCL
jgi:hypothetical protein